MASQRLSKREQQIMEVIFRLEEASAEEIREAMEDAPSNASVRTLLRILVEKGQLQFRQEGLRYVYQAAVSPQEARTSALRRVLDTFFGGSPSRAVATMLSDREITEDELELLQDMIEKARIQGH